MSCIAFNQDLFEFHFCLAPEARRGVGFGKKCYFPGGLKVTRAQSNENGAGERGREDVGKGK